MTPLSHIQQRITALYEVARQRFGRTFVKPYVRMDLRGTTAGQAWPSKNMLRFNAMLYAQNSEHFLHHTVAHEVAHLLAYELFGRGIKPHGKEWQGIMERVFKVPAERCHQYDTQKSRTTRQWDYQCGCQGKIIKLSAVRHNRMIRGTTVYRCVRCNEPLKLAH